MRGPFGPEYLGHPEVVPTQTTIVPLGPDYFDGSPGDQAPERRDRAGDKEGGDRHRNTNIKSMLGYQTKGGLDVVAQPPRLNVANSGVAHPSPGGTSMTTDSPREALHRPITLADQRLPPPPKDPYLLEGFDPRGEPLSAHGPTAAHPTHLGGGETYAPPDWAPMRRE